MKFKALLPVAAVILISQLIFSCSNKEYFSFSPATPAYTKAKPAPANVAEINRPAKMSERSITPVAKPAALEAEPVLEATTKASAPVLFEKKTTRPNLVTPLTGVKTAPENQQTTLNEETTLQAAKERLTTMSKAEKKELRKEIRKSIRENAASDTNILLIILAILIPPLAVGLYEGITNRFWISLLLTLLFFIPGVIYALLVVTDSI